MFHNIYKICDTRRYRAPARAPAPPLRRRIGYIEDTKSDAQGTTAPGSVRDTHGDRRARALDRCH